MSTRESISRYNLIIKKLRKNPSTFKEIENYLSLESKIQFYNFNVSKRTFQRDLEDIRSIYNIDIQYNFSSKVYYIDLDHQPEVNERIFEAFDTFNALNISDRLSNHIHFEKRRPQGTENLYGLLHAIKNNFQIRFSYHKYWEDEITERIVEPYALKEFKNLWYVLSKDLKDNIVKTFALDRLSELDISKKKFQFPENFDINKYFNSCFGIIGPNDSNPQEVVLAFDSLQGKYIKSLPLHESQKILQDTEFQLIIRLKLYITFDFIMEILSYGARVKVIEPNILIEKVKEAYQTALKQY